MMEPVTYLEFLLPCPYECLISDVNCFVLCAESHNFFVFVSVPPSVALFGYSKLIENEQNSKIHSFMHPPTHPAINSFIDSFILLDTLFGSNFFVHFSPSKNQVFLAEILIRCRMGFFDCESGELIMDPRLIFDRYVNLRHFCISDGGFALDLFAIIPWHLILRMIDFEWRSSILTGLLITQMIPWSIKGRERWERITVVDEKYGHKEV